MNRNFIRAKFTFSENWNGLTKIAIFHRGRYAIHVPLENDECQIPNELMETIGSINVSVYAGNLRTTNTAAIRITESGFTEPEPPEPLPPEINYEFVQTPNNSVLFIRVQNGIFEFFANGVWNEVLGGGGGNGSSNIAWLPVLDSASNLSWVRSSTTTPPAPQNIRGLPGIDGTDGTNGTNGTNGANGTNGIDGNDGADGEDGASAYDIWLSLGNDGTEQDFIDSLRGTDGANGTDGSNGASAYEIWLSKGNYGSEQDFLDSLKGMKGDNGMSAFESAVLGGYTSNQTQFYYDLAALDGLGDAILSITGVA